MTQWFSNAVWHKWLSLLVGLQLLIWLATGLYFNLMDHDKASGNQYRQSVIAEVPEVKPGFYPLQLLPGKSPLKVDVVWVAGHPYYQLYYSLPEHNYQLRESQMRNAITGEPWLLDAQTAQRLAEASYTGPGQASQAELLTPPFADLVRQQNPLWQVSFDDEINTVVYLDKDTGQVVRHINDHARLKDLMLKLHFMDYFNTGGFNHPLIILVGLMTLGLSLTGITWLFQRFRQGQLRLWLSPKTVSVDVTYSKDGSRDRLLLRSGASLFEALAGQQIFLPSSCAGGGTCGRCKVTLSPDCTITAFDKAQLQPTELQQGVRLACQHNANEARQLTLNQNSAAQTYQLQVSSTRFITPFIKEIRFNIASGQSLNYHPGAYMKFHIPPGENHTVPLDIPLEFVASWQSFTQRTYHHQGGDRNYSMASFAQNSTELVFNVRWQVAQQEEQGKIQTVAGMGSGWLGALQPGQMVNATGPFSEFYSSQDSNKQRVFVGAGSGMAPLRCIIQSLLANDGKASGNEESKVLFIFGAQSQQHLLYQEEFTRLAANNERFTWQPVLSRADERWCGRRGYVQDALSDWLKQQNSLSNTEFYLCGPPEMMTSVQTLLQTARVVPSQIFKDDFTR